jgi:hypothetical protein
MRRPSDRSYVWLTAATSLDHKIEIRKAALRRGMTVSAFVRAACTAALKAAPATLGPRRGELALLGAPVPKRGARR